MRIRLASPRGFCAGVRMAIGALDLALERLGPPIYVYHEIVHNRHVVERFSRRGAQFVDSIEDIPEAAVVMFSAHGVSPAVRRQAEDRRLRTIDATCPLVAKVHTEAIRFARQGRTVILIGHAGHDEIVGTMGEAPDAIRLVESVEDVSRLDLDPHHPVAWLSQTTLSVAETRRVVDALKQRFPQIVGPNNDDICYATQNRQSALASLCNDADIVVVVGSRNSSNSVRLRELAEDRGLPALLVDHGDELSLSQFEPGQTVAVTAGASVPEGAVTTVVNRLVEAFDAIVEPTPQVEEEQVFRLPVSLQNLETSAPRN